MARIVRAVTLRHRTNTGAGVEEVAFEAGEEVTVLEEWAERILCKKANGQMFNVPRELIEL